MSKVAKNPETSASAAPEEQVKLPGISRRTLLAGGASAAFVGLAGLPQLPHGAGPSLFLDAALDVTLKGLEPRQHLDAPAGA